MLAGMASRGSRLFSSICVLSAIACGGGGPADVDAGGDATVLRRDSGIDAGDAGPPPRAALCDPSAPAPGPYPAPEAFPPPRGPGLGARTFTDAELGVNCAFLDAGEMDVSDHHNLATMYDGYLLLPAAPEYGRGQLAFFDVSDPCAPERVSVGFSETMRETHSIGFSSLNGRWAVVNEMTQAVFRGRGGIQFWDLSDTAAPRHASDLELPGFQYPDAYARVSLSVFWQVPYVYVAAADNGIYIVDAVDPESPVLIGQYQFEPVLRAGQVQAVGNVLIVTAAEGARTVLLDVSDPEDPQPIPGGDFGVIDAAGEERDCYFTNTSGGYVWYARKEGGGGVMVMDIHDPSSPTYAGDYRSDGNGGYVFVHEGHAFVGESSFATIYDVADLSSITPVRTLDLPGDLDTAVPFGNVVLLSVDDEAEPDHGSAIAPWQAAPDTVAPIVTWAWPADGATALPPTSRFGVTMSEHVDVSSVWEGSVRLYREGMEPDRGRVAGTVTAQEAIVTFTPLCPLAAGRYVLEIPAGGVRDFAGNSVAETFRATFEIGG